VKWLLERMRQRRVHRELAEEIEAHIAERIDDLVDAGMSPKEARQKALRDFGNAALYLESSREVWSCRWLEDLAQDLRYAARGLRRSPVFTAVIVLSLALGIGANTAIFTLMDAVMWRSLPVKEPTQLWVPHFERPVSPQSFLFNYGAMGNEYFFSYRMYRNMRDSGVAEIAAYSPVRLNVSIDGGMEPAAEGQRISGNYFSVMGVEPLLGRSITDDDDRIGAGHPVVVIAYNYWQRRFNRDPSAIGRSISISGTPFEIVGIAPPGFFGIEVGTSPDIYVPVAMQPVVTPVTINGVEGPGAGRAWLQLVARIRPGAAVQQVRNALQAIHTQTPDGPRSADAPLILSPAATGISGLRLRFSRTLMILMGVVALVLLISCANIANLLLARAASRRKEFGVRLALGAGRWRVVKQLLTESVALAALGGLCGALLSRVVTRLLLMYISTGGDPVVLDLRPDVNVLAFTAAISVLTGILFGIAPALRATRVDSAQDLKQPHRFDGSIRSLRPGKVLVGAQVALSLLLLIGAGLFVRSLGNLNRQDSGFPREAVLVVRVEPKDSNQRNAPGVAQRLDRLYRDLIRRVEDIPGVRSASMGNVSPTKPESGAAAGTLGSGPGGRTAVSAQMVYPGYFETLGLRIASGRDFDTQDLDADSAPVCIVNEKLVRMAFPDGQALGKPCVASSNASRGLIVGVVKDCRYTDLKSATEPVVYQPFLQTRTSRGQMILHVRIGPDVDSASIIPRVKEEVWKADKDVPQFEVRTLAEEVDAVLIQERLIATLSSFFGGLALLLAALGLYGLLAFTVIQRNGELGIRVALGARPSVVMWMILKEALLLIAAGLVVGVPVALAAGRIASGRLSDLLFQLEPSDPWTLGAAVVGLTVVAMLAAWLPARRAARIDPISALRND
jgi:predicted permease